MTPGTTRNSAAGKQTWQPIQTILRLGLDLGKPLVEQQAGVPRKFTLLRY